LDAIWTWQSGFWYTLFGINDSCFCNDRNAHSLRPDVVVGQSVNGGPGTPGEVVQYKRVHGRRARRRPSMK
jgi:hypothetical protein